jgi:transcriptional regulator with XRE-family HTH domain
MSDVAHSIDLNLPEKLRDREYRQKFFLVECSAEIAAQLIALRKRRDLNQGDVAELIDTQQPAISRYEKADYLSRSFSILQKIADVLDARIRVLIEPSEDILHEYSEEETSAHPQSSDAGMAAQQAQSKWVKAGFFEQEKKIRPSQEDVSRWNWPEQQGLKQPGIPL